MLSKMVQGHHAMLWTVCKVQVLALPLHAGRRQLAHRV